MKKYEMDTLFEYIEDYLKALDDSINIGEENLILAKKRKLLKEYIFELVGEEEND